MLIGWDVGVLIYLVAAAVVMAQLLVGRRRCKSNAAAQDEGAFAILILTVAAGMASLGAIFAELATHRAHQPALRPLRRARDRHRGAVLDLHPHHLRPALRPRVLRRAARARAACEFPGDGQPDYWDFVYFSFVIGMTFQVSDVAVTHKSIRRMVVAHGVLSFFFTTAMIAMTVNIAASIIQK